MNTDGASWLPLAGVRVLDFSVLLPGPFATVVLADLGADVIKVEPPAGDFARRIPTAMFRMANRNKRSVTLDLKRADARRVAERLARWADVAIEAFRPGVADRLGVGYEALCALNPRLVYCSLSGYGQTGPERLQPGHDLNYLAASGAAALRGQWSQKPQRSGVTVADLAGGAYAAIAMLAALRDRDRTGCGVYLDLSLTEAALSFAACRNGLEVDGPTNAYLYPTNDLFDTADGRTIALGIVEEQFWQNFLLAAGDLAPDLRAPEYAGEPQRRERGDRLIARLREVLQARNAADWMERFERHDVPARIVVGIAEASRSAQMRAREMVQERDGERHVPFPVRAGGRRGGALRWVAPEAGAHTGEVLAELGLGADGNPVEETN